MEISYKLERFEGPLDLLLYLIERDRVDIYDIPIVSITEQYLNYMNHLETDDLEISPICMKSPYSPLINSLNLIIVSNFKLFCDL